MVHDRWSGVAQRPGVVVSSALALVAVAFGAWWTVRPPDHPPVETILPRAVGATSATGSAGLTTTTSAGLVIHVVGAVLRPGVVRVGVGARVLDAVHAAGGLGANADATRVNLAAKLVDGQRVAVPAIGDPLVALPMEPNGVDSAASPSAASPINVNDATAAQLDALPGVGPATAAAIVAHRDQHGPFASIDALGDVRGIGSVKLEQLRPLVTV